MSNQITIHGQQQVGLTESQWQMVTDTYMKGATAEEVQIFRMVAERAGLDPWKKQIHAVKRWDSKEGRNVWTFQTGIDGYTAIAHRSGLCAGIDDATFEPADESTPTPKKATVTVWRMVKGERRPFTASARWSEYAQTGRDKKTGDEYLTGLWKKMPYGQLAKCARALALRLAFPEETSGIYVDAEMEQADNEVPPPETKPAPKTGSAPEYRKERNVTPADQVEHESSAPTKTERADEITSLLENDAWREVVVPDGFGISSGMVFGDVKRQAREEIRIKATGEFRAVADASIIAEIQFLCSGMKMQPPAAVPAMANMEPIKLLKLLDGIRKQYRETTDQKKETEATTTEPT